MADMVTDFLGHLSTSPGSFESDIGYISDTLNSSVNTEETLNELVDLIFTQVRRTLFLFDISIDLRSCRLEPNPV